MAVIASIIAPANAVRGSACLNPSLSIHLCTASCAKDPEFWIGAFAWTTEPKASGSTEDGH
jgi:hypothetical protein